MKKRDLTKKVLCTVLAASVFGVCGNAFAEDYEINPNEEPQIIAGEELAGKNVIVKGNGTGANVTVNGEYNIEKLTISGESQVVFKDGGSINGGIETNSGIDLSLTTNNAQIKGEVVINAGAVTFNGGTMVAKDYHQESEGKYVQDYIRVNEGSYLETNKVTITGNVMAEGTNAEGDGSIIVINDSTINESEWYAQGEDYNNGLVMVDGKPVVDGYSDVQAEIGGNVTITNSAVNSSLDAQGEGSLITLNNSSVNTKGGVIAWNGGKIVLKGDENTVYQVDTDGQGYGYFMAAKLEGEQAGSIEITGGTLKADNLRYIVGIEGNNYAYLNPEYDAEHIANFEVVKGGIVLKDNGVIETKGDQIFEHGVDVSSDEAVLASTSGAVTNDAISYVGGTLKLTDEKYSLNYVDSAKDALIDYQSDSETKIVMTGTLVTGSGNNENEIDVDDAASIGDDVELDQVTVNADKNLLVGSDSDNASGKFDGVVVEDKVANGFSAGKLNLAADSTGMVITNAKNVTLGGSAGGELITVDGKAGNVNVVVGTTTDVPGADVKTGSFTVGNSLATSDTVYNLSGSVTVNEGSALNVNGKTTVTEGVELNGGSVNVGNGTLENTNVTANGNSTITGAAQVGTLTGADGAVINIGNKYKAGNVTVTNAELNGATVFLDPTWVDGAEITDASKMAVAGTNGKVTLNGKYVVGENSVMSFGVGNNEKAQETFAKTGLTWGEDATAGLYINGSVNVANGAIVVDGSMETAPAAPANGTFAAAENSVVMVDGQSINKEGTAAITGVTTVTVEDTSKLYIDGAKKGEIYHVIDGANADWQDANIVSDNALLKFEGDGVDTDSKFDVTASYNKVDNVYGAGAVEIANIVDKTLETKYEGDKAFDFFNAAANANNNATKDAQIAAFNSAANMGELAGVNHGTYSMSNAMTDAVAHHLSLATHGEQDKDIWAHYIHNKEDIDGMDFGGVDGSYEAQYNGIVVGSDLYKNGKTTAGIALSYADGNINGSNIASSTKNDAEYYGASLYGRIDNGDSAILGDISYMHSDNDITQNNSGHEITASADADAFSIGIRAEQAYKAGAGKFVPYAGIRYMHLGAGDYSNSLGMEYNADDQNLWLLPVGVTYSAEVQSGDWTVKPIAEVGYVWTMGDRDTDQTVSLNGASDTFGFETADSGSFIGRLGIEAEKADVTYGLSYEYQKGDTVKANKWMANLTWSF